VPYPGEMGNDNIADMTTPRIAAALLLLALPASAQTRAFTGLTLFDGTGRPTIADATILVRDGRIVAAGSAAAVTVPSGAERISLAGKFAIPGLINAHGHINGNHDLNVYAAYGTTTVFSLGAVPDEVFAARDQQASPTLSRARVFIASPALAVFDPDSATSAVVEATRKKIDWVKIRVDDNLGTTRKSPPEAFSHAIDVAHGLKLPVAAHLYYFDDAKRLVEANVDVLAHSIRDVEIDEAFVERVREARVCYIPTLMREVSTYVYESTPAFFADPLFAGHANRDWVAQLSRPERQAEFRNSTSGQKYRAQLPIAKRNLRRLADAGALVAMGTDTGPFGRFQGYFELLELEQMTDAGLTPRQAIVAATRDAARCMKVERDLGTLEAGKWADFVVLDADPFADINNVRKINSVYIAGNKVAR
jgi:imidazolonepropionase-like amidohydrolase